MQNSTDDNANPREISEEIAAIEAKRRGLEHELADLDFTHETEALQIREAIEKLSHRERELQEQLPPDQPIMSRINRPRTRNEKIFAFLIVVVTFSSVIAFTRILLYSFRIRPQKQNSLVLPYKRSEFDQQMRLERERELQIIRDLNRRELSEIRRRVRLREDPLSNREEELKRFRRAMLREGLSEQQIERDMREVERLLDDPRSVLDSPID